MEKMESKKINKYQKVSSNSKLSKDSILILTYFQKTTDRGRNI